MLVGIRKRVREKYSLPFSDDVPVEWKAIVTRGNLQEKLYVPPGVVYDFIASST
jgi:hypothetical protein